MFIFHIVRHSFVDKRPTYNVMKNFQPMMDNVRSCKTLTV